MVGTRTFLCEPPFFSAQTRTHNRPSNAYRTPQKNSTQTQHHKQPSTARKPQEPPPASLWSAKNPAKARKTPPKTSLPPNFPGTEPEFPRHPAPNSTYAWPVSVPCLQERLVRVLVCLAFLANVRIEWCVCAPRLRRTYTGRACVRFRLCIFIFACVCAHRTEMLPTLRGPR